MDVLGHVTVVVDDALSIVKFLLSELALWFASPAKLYAALAVPAFVLLVYVAVGVKLRPPAPVTATVHGVSGDPVNVADDGQVTAVVEEALPTANDCIACGAALKLALPAWSAVTVHEPTPTKLIVDPEALHMLGVDVPNVTGLPEPPPVAVTA